MTVVLLALGCSLCVALAKLAAAAWTGSSAMLATAIHSLVDTSSQALVLYGLKRSAHTNARDRFGDIGELYFWSYVVAVLLFSMGAGVALHEGVRKLADPQPIAGAGIAYVVLGIAILLVGWSTWRAAAGPVLRHRSPVTMAALRASGDPALLTVVLEGFAALAGLLAALAGVLAAHLLGAAAADAIASVVIGLILAAVAAFMSIELQRIIVGSTAGQHPLDRETSGSEGVVTRADASASTAASTGAQGAQAAPATASAPRKKSKRPRR